MKAPIIMLLKKIYCMVLMIADHPRTCNSGMWVSDQASSIRVIRVIRGFPPYLIWTLFPVLIFHEGRYFLFSEKELVMRYSSASDKDAAGVDPLI